MRTQTYPVRRDSPMSQNPKFEFSRLDYEQIHSRIGPYLTKLRSADAILESKDLGYVIGLEKKLPEKYTLDSLKRYRIMGEIGAVIDTHNRNEDHLTQAKIEERTRELCGLRRQSPLTPEQEAELDNNLAHLHAIEWH